MKRAKKNCNNNHNTESQAKHNHRLSLKLKHRLHEGAIILIAAVAFYLLMVLTTYHRSDPAWSTTGNGIIANAGGPVGAWLADVLLYIFGYPAYIFPLLLALAVWGAITRGFVYDKVTWWFVLLRLISFIIVLATACALITLILPHINAGLPNNGGGIVGLVISNFFKNTFSEYGGILILLSFFLSSITLLLGFSWLAVIKTLHTLVFSAIKWLLARFLIALQKLIAQFKLKWASTAKTDLPYDQKHLWQIEAKGAAKPLDAAIDKPIVSDPRPPVEHKKNPPVIALKPQSIPPLSLLERPPTTNVQHRLSTQALWQMSAQLEQHLAHFGIKAKVSGIEPGPVITRFEVALAPGMKASRVTNIDKDLARSMSVSSVRVVEVIPGKAVIGLEVPNRHREIVYLQQLFASNAYKQSRSALTLALGKDIAGHAVVTDLRKMPHLLVAGTTGSGKSVALNAMLLSMLFKATSKELRLILIDPKMLELSVYKDIPHLLVPVVTDMKEASNALRWCVAEMERRYSLMAAVGVRNIAGLNYKIAEAEKRGKPVMNPLMTASTPQSSKVLTSLPNIVVLIDELADMMMIVGKKVEQLIARIAQKARAAGIHMILATQRPSVDVITGLIKANIPCRIAFNVSSRVDSRTILDQQGAHQLLGYGDMLFLPPGTSLPKRVHGPYVADEEVRRVVESLKQCGQPDYLPEILAHETQENDSNSDSQQEGEKDPLYDKAVALVLETKRASISLVQRRLRIGYNRAANLLETMEAAGVVSAMHNGVREILVPKGDN